MMTKRNLFVVITFIFTFQQTKAQQYQAVLKDENNKEIIPYASIIFDENKGIITNEEGRFTLDLGKIRHDSIYISSIGFQPKAFAVNKLKDSILFLSQEVEQLDLVYLNSKNYSAEDIMDFVEEGIDSNYTPFSSNKKVFYRQSFITTISKLEMKIKESSIEEIDKKLLDSIKTLIPRKSEHFTEVLANYYSHDNSQKMVIHKAAELYDKDVSLSMEGISEKLEKIFTENVKTDSYLKIKSGIFGSKVQVDSILAANEKVKETEEELKAKDSLASDRHMFYLKRSINNLYKSLFYKDDSKLNLIEKLNRYKYSLNGYAIIDEEPCYIINFEPKGSKEFKGIVYVNVNDFAIVRINYNNVKHLKSVSLLGISYKENLYTSKVFFRKENNNYTPYFIKLDRGYSFGVDRPLRIIEKNKHASGRRKQNEVSLKIDMKINELERFEYLVYETTEISSSEYEEIEEKEKFNTTYLPKYDPEFWEDEHIVEPNKRIQNFSIKQ